MTLSKFTIPPDQADYSYESPQDVVTINLDGGLSRSRRDIVGCPAIINVSWTFDLSGYQYFRSFYNSTCQRGVAPFLMDLLLDQPFLTEHTCKFVGNSVKMERPYGLSRVVTAQIEAIPIENEDLDETLVTIHELGLDCSNAFGIFSALEKLVNVDYPIDTLTPALQQLVNVDLETSIVDPILLSIPDDDLFDPLEQLVNEDLE